LSSSKYQTRYSKCKDDNETLFGTGEPEEGTAARHLLQVSSSIPFKETKKTVGFSKSVPRRKKKEGRIRR
jgi:hypothetical protein